MNGYVYVLTHACMPGLVKVGFTMRSPWERAAELSRATGVPGAFSVAWAAEVLSPRDVEAEVHHALARYRVTRGREFFRCDVSLARAEIERASQRMLRRVHEKGRGSMLKWMWLGASVCALIAALTHPESAWIVGERVFRVGVSLAHFHHPYR